MTDDLRASIAWAVHDVLPPPCSPEELRQLGLVVDAVMGVLKSGPQPEPNLGEQMRRRPTGVYRLFWYSGGCSVSAVGQAYDGARWYAPANWTSKDLRAVVSTDWSPVKSAELIESYQGSRRKRPRKGASDA